MRHFDAIIIGSGISGLNFALRAAEQKKRVLVITKKKVAQSNTNFAQGGIAAVLSKLDNHEKHVKDTLVAGCFHNNKKAVEYMVRHGASAINRLMELGVPFATQHGELLLTREGGHSERRIAFVSDYTGQAIEKMLVRKVRKSPYITLCEHTFAADLLVKNRACHGVRILRNPRSGEKNAGFENIYANITVLATGGIGQLFANTTNPTIATGDGIGMAFRAKDKFKDMEFVQFHPTALKLKGKPCFLISEAVRGEGAYLINSKGKRFMKRYHKLAELAPRDIVSRAIFKEEQNGPVFLDLRHKNPEFIKARFPQIYQKLKSYGIDMARDLIPVSPAAHYSCGGIKVDLRGQTDIENLYAFGETACTGVHGANRLASNSLLEALVFSDRILNIKNTISPQKPVFKVPCQKPLTKQETRRMSGLRRALQKTMWEFVGIIRTKKGLEKALNVFETLETQLSKIQTNNRQTIELKNMLAASKLITKSAHRRKQSLGCHCRTD